MEISTDKLPEVDQLIRIFNQTTWAKGRNEDAIRQLLKNTSVFVVIKKENQLIGFGRALSDGIYRALLEDIVVHENYRNQKIGSVIVKNLIQQLDGVQQIFLHAKPELEGFYRHFGFSKSGCLTMNR